MKEKQKQRDAFERYFAMGAGRSLMRLAKELRVAESTVKVWSRVFRWAERIEQRSRQTAAALVKQVGDTADEELAKDKQIVRLGLAHVTKHLVEGKLKGNVSDIERMIRLKRELDADSRKGEDLNFTVTWANAAMADEAPAVEDQEGEIRPPSDLSRSDPQPPETDPN